MTSEQTAARPARASRLGLLVFRVGLPLTLLAIGIALIVLGHAQYKSFFASRDSLLSGLGVAMVIIALGVWLLDWMMQMSAESDQDRAQEDAAREHFARTGSWPSDDENA